MGSLTKLRTFSSVPDVRDQLSNSNSARLWSADIGTTWNQIRVGCRISMTDGGVELSGTPRFAFGICSGTSNIFQDATTTHWLGMLSNDPIWSRVAGPPAYHQMQNVVASVASAKRIGSTTTVGTAFNNSPFVFDATTANRGVIFLDITKGSPNFTLNAFFRWTGTASDVSVADYLDQLVVASPTITNHQATTSPTIAIDEAANGFFNAVNFAWDKTAPVIEISDIAVVKFS